MDGRTGRGDESDPRDCPRSDRPAQPIRLSESETGFGWSTVLGYRVNSSLWKQTEPDPIDYALD